MLTAGLTTGIGRRAWCALLAYVVATACVLHATRVEAQEVERAYDFGIREETLGAALAAIARQTDLVVLYPHELASKTGMKPVVGRYTVREAIKMLFRDTQFSGGLTERGVIYISISGNEQAHTGEGDMADRKVRRSLWTSVAAFLFGSGVHAQDVSLEAGGKIEEIIVTAQKREERLQDVPISLSVLSGEDLDGFTAHGLTDALSRVPGVATTVHQQGGETVMSVRGVAPGGGQAAGSSPVAYYLDSVPFGLVKTAVGPDATVYDLERVEVLRGPQGTLYGASALNGVVRILTKDPDLDEYEFKARTSLSSTEGGDENYRGDMAVNIPLIPGKFAARAVAGYERLSGWINRPSVGEDNANDSKLRNARIKLGAQPTDRLSIDVSSWLSRADLDQSPLGRSDELSTAPIAEPAATDYDVHGLSISYDFSSFSIASTTSYLDYHNDSTLSVAANPLLTQFDAHVFAQEVILNSAGEGSWRWSLGGMYRDATDRFRQTHPTALPVPNNSANLSESVAVFGELTRILFDGELELTAGWRHFEDDVTQEDRRNISTQAPPVSRTFDADTPRVVITWLPSERFTIYATYAEGFRSGFNQDAATSAQFPNAPPVEADTLKNYELGTKLNVLENRLAFDAAVYYMDWQDVQQPIALQFGSTFFTVPTNAGSASGMGFDVSLIARPMDRLELGLSYSWNGLETDEDVFSGGGLLFAKGDRLIYSPETTAGLSVDYSIPIGSRGYLARLSAAANYTSERAVQTVIATNQVVWAGDPLTYGRASLSLESPRRWTMTVFAENLNNEDGVPIRNIFNNPDRTVHMRPRTIGLQFEIQY